MKFLVVLLTTIIIGSYSNAQEDNTKLIDYDKENYEENVFNKEFDEEEDTTDAIRRLYDRIPEKLPDWVFHPVELGESSRIVGYSDPNMEKEEAYKQAILRAKAMYALLKTCNVSNITDDYTNLKESGKYSLYTTKFQDFSLSKTVLPYTDSLITVLDTLYTKYQEGIVLIEFQNQADSLQHKDTLTIKGEHLQVFIERNFKKEKIEFFNFTVQDNLFSNDSSDLFAQYNYKVINRGYDIYSLYNNKPIDFVERTYNYRCNADYQSDSADLEFNYFRLNRGLWNAYISGVLSNFTNISKQLSSQVKNSNDFYTLKTEGLIRTVARNKITFRFNNFKMVDNQFYIDLNGIIIQ
ncbi:MAG: hypothetical protein KQH79_14760 [Bacteroidetes bacterium]|nr:hypothetical protein [Bacteroidota bacterium]